MAKRLDNKTIETIKGCYGKEMKTVEIQELMQERFGLDIKYNTIRNYKPAVLKGQKAYYERPDVKAHKKFRVHAKKIGEMADNVEQNIADSKKTYIFSRKEGEENRKKILDYIGRNPGAYRSEIIRALDSSCSAIAYNLRRLENEGNVDWEMDGIKVRYRVAEEK